MFFKFHRTLGCNISICSAYGHHIMVVKTPFLIITDFIFANQYYLISRNLSDNRFLNNWKYGILRVKNPVPKKYGILRVKNPVPKKYGILRVKNPVPKKYGILRVKNPVLKSTGFWTFPHSGSQ